MLSCVKCELRAAAAVQERTGQDRLGRNMLVHTQLCIVCTKLCGVSQKNTCVHQVVYARNMLVHTQLCIVCTKFCMLGTVGLLCAQSWVVSHRNMLVQATLCIVCTKLCMIRNKLVNVHTQLCIVFIKMCSGLLYVQYIHIKGTHYCTFVSFFCSAH